MIASVRTVMLAGALMAAFSLHIFAYAGFAPDGHLPWVNVLVFAVGVALVALRPKQMSPRLTEPAPTTG